MVQAYYYVLLHALVCNYILLNIKKKKFSVQSGKKDTIISLTCFTLYRHFNVVLYETYLRDVFVSITFVLVYVFFSIMH